MSRELDAKVAEKVFGHKVQKERDTAFIQERYRFVYWREPPRGIYPQQLGKDGSPGWADIDEYTTSPMADYQVLQHVRNKWDIERYKLFCFSLISIFNKRKANARGFLESVFAVYEPGDYSKAALLALGEKLD